MQPTKLSLTLKNNETIDPINLSALKKLRYLKIYAYDLESSNKFYNESTAFHFDNFNIKNIPNLRRIKVKIVKDNISSIIRAMEYFQAHNISIGKTITFVVTEFKDNDLAWLVNKYVIPSTNINLEFQFLDCLNFPIIENLLSPIQNFTNRISLK